MNISMFGGSSVWRDIRLFWISSCMLFFEILIIRWISAEIRIFSYFHNLVLLFAFLGIGLGAALQRTRRNYFLLSFLLMTLLVILVSLDRYVGVSPLQNISAFLSLGTDFLIWWRPSSAPLPIRALALLVGGTWFLIVMAMLTVFFIPFGQMLGSLVNEYERPLRAYAINLAGSLVGIWLFSAASLFSLPPAIWFAFGGLSCVLFLRGSRQAIGASLLVALSVLLLQDERLPERWTLWSPYQKLTVVPESTLIDGERVQYGYRTLVNSVGYMQMTNYSPDFVRRFPSAFPAEEVPYDHYNIPYRFSDKPGQVLIVGSGTGNDVAGALRNGSDRVTAVEIDAAIIAIGRELHPESPYSDHRVTVINDDARSFFKRSKEQYDMIVFGLLDSHTLSSSYSNVRLDSYVYTLESFQEAERLLKPDGVMVLIFEVQDDFIGTRIEGMLAQAFGRQPVAFAVRSGFRGWGGIAFVAGNEDQIARRLAEDPILRRLVEERRAHQESLADPAVPLAVDDWPYLYLERAGIPALYFLVFGVLMLFSFVGVRAVSGRQRAINWHFFFLGAGFLLLEVQNISKLALLFGSTWSVNIIVISAILVMISFANLYVIRLKVGSLKPYYAALLISLIVNLVLPLSTLGQLPSGLKELVVGAIMGLPVFFAGVIFSVSFATTEDRAGALAANLIGAMAGGMLESLSFLLGVKALLMVACFLYLFSLLTERSRVPRGVSVKS